VRTVTALQSLNKDRKEAIFNFLKAADLWKKTPERVGLLSGSRMPGINLQDANLDDADLSGAELYRANLSGAFLINASLVNAIINRADLSDAKLYGADLSGALLIEANLSGAKLNKANLSAATLDGAEFSGANLYGADLYGANLSCVSTLTKKQIITTRNWELAIYSEAEFNKDKHKWSAKNPAANKDIIKEIKKANNNDIASNPTESPHCKKLKSAK